MLAYIYPGPALCVSTVLSDEHGLSPCTRTADAVVMPSLQVTEVESGPAGI